MHHKAADLLKLRYSCANRLTPTTAFNLLHLLCHLDGALIKSVWVKGNISPLLVNGECPVELISGCFSLPYRIGGNLPGDRGWGAVKAESVYMELSIDRRGQIEQQLVERMVNGQEVECKRLVCSVQLSDQAKGLFSNELIRVGWVGLLREFISPITIHSNLVPYQHGPAHPLPAKDLYRDYLLQRR